MKYRCTLLLFLLLIGSVLPADAQTDWKANIESDSQLMSELAENTREVKDSVERREIVKKYLSRFKVPGMLNAVLYSVYTWFGELEGEQKNQAIASYLESIDFQEDATLIRAVILSHAADFHGKAGNREAVERLEKEISAVTAIGFEEHLRLAQAAAGTEQWEMALEHAQAAMEKTAHKYGYETGGTEEIVPERLGSAAALKLQTLARTGNTEQAEEVWEQVRGSIARSYAGNPKSRILYYLGEMYFARGQHQQAIETLTVNALFDHDKRYLELLKQSWEAKHQNLEGLDAYLWQSRQKLARQAGPAVFENYEGEAVALEDFRDKVVLLSFWFPRCAPCRRELPALQPGYQELHDQGFEIVVIDSRRNVTDGLAFIEESGLEYAFLLNGEGSQESVSSHFGVGIFPTSFLLDRNGKVMFSYQGFTPGDEEKILSDVRFLLDKQMELE